MQIQLITRLVTDSNPEEKQYLGGNISCIFPEVDLYYLHDLQLKTPYLIYTGQLQNLHKPTIIVVG